MPEAKPSTENLLEMLLRKIFGDDKDKEQAFLEELRAEQKERAALAEKKPEMDEITKALPQLLGMNQIPPQDLEPKQRDFYGTVYKEGLMGELNPFHDVNPGIQHFNNLFARTPTVDFWDLLDANPEHKI